MKIRNVVKKHFSLNSCSNKQLANAIRKCRPEFDFGEYNDKTIMKIFYYQLIGKEIDFLGKPKNPKTKLEFAKSDDFLRSFKWRRCRMLALKANDGRCECCGRNKHDGIILHVDHIKPRMSFPRLALDPENLQVLCNECNHGKGNWDETDWRKAQG